MFSILDVLPEDGKDALFYDTYGFILTPKNHPLPGCLLIKQKKY